MAVPNSIGISSPWLRRLSMHPRIASFTIARASSMVSPSVTSPGSAALRKAGLPEE